MADATRCLEVTAMGCAACTQSDQCDACHTDRIMKDGRCLGKGEVRDLRMSPAPDACGARVP